MTQTHRNDIGFLIRHVLEELHEVDEASLNEIHCKLNGIVTFVRLQNELDSLLEQKLVLKVRRGAYRLNKMNSNLTPRLEDNHVKKISWEDDDETIPKNIDKKEVDVPLSAVAVTLTEHVEMFKTNHKISHAIKKYNHFKSRMKKFIKNEQ